MLPKGWKRRPLDEIAQVTSGGTPERSEPSYWGGDIPWVTTGEIRFNTITSTEQKITVAGLKNSSAKLFPPGTLLMAMYGQGKTRGQVARLGIQAATNQACAAILLRGDNNPDFYFHVLSSQYESLRELGNAGTQQNLNCSIIKQISVPVPPPIEQLRIATVLSKWDEAIATTESLLTNSVKQKKALMRSLLSPTANKLGWKLYQLDELFSERNETRREDLPLLSITREDGVILRDDVGRKDTSNEDKSNYLRICPGDIGYNTMRMWQGVSALSSLEGIVSPAYTIVVPNEKIDARFAAYLFKLDRMIFAFYRHSQGLVSDTWNLKFSHFKKISVFIPSKAEQKKVVSILSASDEVIAVLSKKLMILREEKSALMQQLLTGKRRVRLPSKSEATTA